MTTGIPCFQYVSQTDAVQNYVQLVGLIWMQFNMLSGMIHLDEQSENALFLKSMQNKLDNLKASRNSLSRWVFLQPRKV